MTQLREAANAADEKADRNAELAATEQWVAVARATFGTGSIEYARAIFRHAFTLEEFYRYPEAESLFRETLALRIRLLGASHAQTLAAMSALGDDLNDQGRYVEADKLLGEAARLRGETLGPDHADTLSSKYLLAINMIDQGRFEEAEALSRSVFVARTRLLGATAEPTLSVASTLAHALDHLQDYPQAIALKQLRVDHYSSLKDGDPDDRLSAMNDLAFSQRLAGNGAIAESLNRDVLAGLTKLHGKRHPDVARSHGNLGDVMRDSGRHAEAAANYRTAVDIRRENGGDIHPVTLFYAGKLATSLLAGKDPAALEAARFAVAGHRTRRASSTDRPDENAQHDRDAPNESDQYLNLADANWVGGSASGKAKRRDEAFAAVQEADSGAASRAVAQMAARSGADGVEGELGTLARKRQQLSTQWADADRDLSDALARANPGTATDTAALASRRASLEQEIADLDEAIGARFPDYRSLVRPPPLSLAATQALLDQDEAVLLVAPTRFGTQLFAITRTRVAWSRSAWTRDQVDAAVAKLRRDVVEPESTRDDGYPRFDRATAFALYSQLIGPVASTLRGKKHLFVAAQGSLTGLPFSILVTRPPTGPDDDAAALRETGWLGDRHALIQLPSLQSLSMLRRLKRPSSGARTAPRFAGFGDPILAGAALTRGKQAARGIAVERLFAVGASRSGKALVEPDKLRALASLPGTGTELERMRQALGAAPSSLWLRERATETAFKSADLSAVSVLAIATHGLLAGELAGESEPGLVLTPPERPSETDDGYLSASDVAQLRLSADWVILSACNTAAGDGKTGAPGLSGLARAFFYAGARALLVSHWPVRDDVAADLTVDMLARGSTEPVTRAQALQAAMRAVRLDRRDETRAHPLSWAPFTLVGDGAR